MTSAYPMAVDELAERVRALAARTGALPTQNRVMTEFRVGRPKAAAALAALTGSGFTPNPTRPNPTRPNPTGPDPAGPDTSRADRAPRRLHAVAGSAAHDAAPGESGQFSTPADAVPDPGATAPADPAATAPATAPADAAAPADPVAAVAAPAPEPAREPARGRVRPVRSWPVLLIAVGAFVAIWGGWVGLGELTGFGPVRLLPGIADGFVINSAITLPLGMEAYAFFALRVWLAPPAAVPARARRFAMWSTLAALVLGAAGQIAYHLMTAAGMQSAPWQITAFVSCLPVAVLGCAAALAHLTHTHPDHAGDERQERA